VWLALPGNPPLRPLPRPVPLPEPPALALESITVPAEPLGSGV
jgi:hypothetical protein